MEFGLIQDSLPQIRERVRSKTAEIITRLKQLPEPPEGNLSLKILQKILEFDLEMRSHIDGGSEAYPFRKEWYAAAIQFRHTIAFSYPRLSLKGISAACQTPSRLPYRPSSTPTPSGRRREVIDASDSEVGAAQNVTPSSKRKQPTLKPAQVSPPKRARLHDIPQHTSSQEGTPTARLDINYAAPFAKRFTLTEIRSILQDGHVGLPNQIDAKATKRLIRESLSLWDEPLDELLAFTNKACHTLLVERASSVFGIWHGTQFFEVALDVCQGFVEETFDRQKASAKRVLDVERQTALTLHEDAMRVASKRAFVQLDNACRSERAKGFLMKGDAWDEDWNDRLKAEKLSKVTDAQLGPNPYVHEIRALSVCPSAPP